MKGQGFERADEVKNIGNYLQKVTDELSQNSDFFKYFLNDLLVGLEGKGDESTGALFQNVTESIEDVFNQETITWDFIWHSCGSGLET